MTNHASSMAHTAVERMTPADVERGQWKRWFHVTPKQVADWLSRHNANVTGLAPKVDKS